MLTQPHCLSLTLAGLAIAAILALTALTLTLAVALTTLILGLVGQFTNLYVLEVNLIAVVLQEDMAFSTIAEIWPILVLAIGHEGIPFLIVAVVFEQLRAVEPVLYVAAAHDDEGCVPHADVERLLVGSRDEVVE